MAFCKRGQSMIPMITFKCTFRSIVDFDDDLRTHVSIDRVRTMTSEQQFQFTPEVIATTRDCQCRFLALSTEDHTSTIEE